jgi:hypothetical protein
MGRRAKLTLVASGAPYVISTPRGQVDTDRIPRKYTRVIREGNQHQLYYSRWVIVLDGQGIDVVSNTLIFTRQ